MNILESSPYLAEAGLTQRSQAEAAAPNDELGQDAFLELMIAQFRNQDPFEPMSNGDFLSQLAQFGTVSGIEDLESSFSQLSSAISSDQALQASSLVGHDVLASSEFANHSDTNPIRGALELDGTATGVYIDISDASGQFLKTINLGPQDPGLTNFEWDGTTEDGDTAAAGLYQLNARVVRGDRTDTVPTMIRTEVESISLGRDGRGIRLNTSGQGTLLFSQIDRIL